MTTSSGLSIHRDLAEAIAQKAKRTGEQEPSVRGSDWRLATVATVNATGTLVTTDGLTVRRMETYTSPAVGDLIVIDQSSSGNWLARGRLSTGGIAIGEIADIVKPSNTPRSSVTTVAADPHLAIAVVPGTYRIDAVVFYEADSAADLRLGWSAPSGTTGAWWPGGSDSSNTTQAATARWGALTDIGTNTLPVAGLGAGTVVTCRPVGTAVVTTAGTLALAWAQQTSSATATTVRQNSWLSLRRTA